MDSTPLTPQLSYLEDRHKELDAHERRNKSKDPTSDDPTLSSLCLQLPKAVIGHIWDLPGNYPVFTVVMVIYYYFEIIWGILVTLNVLYNIYEHEYILYR